MFFVKHVGKSRLNPMLQPLVTADMLSYRWWVELYWWFSRCAVYKKINADLFALLCGPMFWLADASIQWIIRWIQPCFFGKDLVFDGRGTWYEVLTTFLRFRFYHDLGCLKSAWMLLCHHWTSFWLLLFGIVGSLSGSLWSGWDALTGIRMFAYWTSLAQWVRDDLSTSGDEKQPMSGNWSVVWGVRILI